MSSPSVSQTAYRVGASETHASPSRSPMKRHTYRSPSPRTTRTEKATPTRSISPSWSPSIRRTVASRRNSPAVPSSPLVDAEKQGPMACDEQRVPVVTDANEVHPGAPLVSLSIAKEALDGDDLKHKYVVLRRLQNQLVSCGSLEEEEAGDMLPFIESMAAVCQALKHPGLGALRVIDLMCSVASTLACLTGPGFTDPASKIVPELLQFLRIPETGLRNAVSQSVETILEECPATSTLHAATASIFDATNPYMRRKGSRFLCFMLEKWPEETLRESRSLIMDQIRKTMVDSDANVRRECRSTFGAFVGLWPVEGVRIYSDLDSASKRATLKDQPFVSNFVGGETTEGSNLTPKTWKSPGIVGSSPASFGRSQSRGIRRFSSPPKGRVRRASRSMSNEESELEIDHLTVRAIMGEDAVAVVEVEGGRHANKMPWVLLMLLVTFNAVVLLGVFGSMGKPPRGVSRAMDRDAGVVVRTTNVICQKELEGGCTAAIDVGCITSEGDCYGTSGLEISKEYDLVVLEGLTPDRASAAVGDISCCPLVGDRGETETSNQHPSERIYHMVEDSNIISAAPVRTEPEVSFSRNASDDSRLWRFIDTISANTDRVNPGVSITLAYSDEERMVNDTSKSSLSARLSEPLPHPATEDMHPVGATDTASLSSGLEDQGEFLSGLALDKSLNAICLVASVITFALVVIWIAGVKRRLLDDGTVMNPSVVSGDENMPTPPRRNAREETQQEEEELGCYNTLEVIKKGNSPGNVRSGKRSRRIESAKKMYGSRRKKGENG